MKYVFEGVFLLISSAFMLSCILASLFAKKAGCFNDSEKNDVIKAFVISGAVTLIFGARMIYLLAVEAGMTLI